MTRRREGGREGGGGGGRGEAEETGGILLGEQSEFLGAFRGVNRCTFLLPCARAMVGGEGEGEAVGQGEVY